MSNLQSATTSLPAQTITLDSLLDSSISETESISLIDKAISQTENPVPNKPTPEQRTEVKILREIALNMGGLPASIAGLNIAPTETDAANYLDCLKAAIAAFKPQIKDSVPDKTREVTAEKKTDGKFYQYCRKTNFKGTPAQWKYIAHLKSELAKKNDPLANRIIPNCKSNASMFIQDMLKALARKLDRKAWTGRRICVCGDPVCRIGPMVQC